MSELKFCCSQFKSYYEAGMYKVVNRVPNIKIIKYRHENPMQIGMHSDLGFCILTGLDKSRDFMKSVPIFIDYCPFCGKKLHKFYKGEAYANVIEEEPWAFLNQLTIDGW